jgi:hypothetical protein
VGALEEGGGQKENLSAVRGTADSRATEGLLLLQEMRRSSPGAGRELRPMLSTEKMAGQETTALRGAGLRGEEWEAEGSEASPRGSLSRGGTRGPVERLMGGLRDRERLEQPSGRSKQVSRGMEAEAEGVGEAEAEGEALREAERLGVALTVPERDGVPVGVPVAEALGVRLEEREALPVPVLSALLEGDSVEGAEGVPVEEEELLGEQLPEGVCVTEAETERLGAREAEEDSEAALAVAELLGVPELVGD